MHGLEPEAERWGRGAGAQSGSGVWPLGREWCTVTFHADEEDAAVLGRVAQVLPGVPAPGPLHPQHLPRPVLLQLHPPLACQALPVLVPAHRASRPGEVHHQLQVPAWGAANPCLGCLGVHHPHGGLCGLRAGGHQEGVARGPGGGQWEARQGKGPRAVGQGVGQVC